MEGAYIPRSGQVKRLQEFDETTGRGWIYADASVNIVGSGIGARCLIEKGRGMKMLRIIAIVVLVIFGSFSCNQINGVARSWDDPKWDAGSFSDAGADASGDTDTDTGSDSDTDSDTDTDTDTDTD